MMRSMNRGSILVGFVLAGLACTKGSGLPQGASNAALGSSAGGGIALITNGLADDPTAIHLSSTAFHDRGNTTTRLVPVPATDHDGWVSNRGGGGPITYAAPQVDCGTTVGDGIDKRIADCRDKNGALLATWDGSTKGNAGQGVWSLVSLTAATSTSPKAVWRDERTKLVWSSIVAPKISFPPTYERLIKSASPAPTFDVVGNINNSTNGAYTIRAVTDDANVSTLTVAFGASATPSLSHTTTTMTVGAGGLNTSIQSNIRGALSPAPSASLSTFLQSQTLPTFPITAAGGGKALYPTTGPGGLTWCQASGSGDTTYCNGNVQSACAEVNPAFPETAALVPAPGVETTWAEGSYSTAKGGMGLLSTGVSVTWRLPTLDDYKQADVDGIRFVLPDMGPPMPMAREWTATFDSYSRDPASGFNPSAFDFGPGQGFISTYDITDRDNVRCVGVAQ